MQVCENVLSSENEIPIASMAKLLKYIVLKRRAQDLAEIEEFKVYDHWCVKVSLLKSILHVLHKWKLPRRMCLLFTPVLLQYQHWTLSILVL